MNADAVVIGSVLAVVGTVALLAVISFQVVREINKAEHKPKSDK